MPRRSWRLFEKRLPRLHAARLTDTCAGVRGNSSSTFPAAVGYCLPVSATTNWLAMLLQSGLVTALDAGVEEAPVNSNTARALQKGSHRETNKNPCQFLLNSHFGSEPVVNTKSWRSIGNRRHSGYGCRRVGRGASGRDRKTDEHRHGIFACCNHQSPRSLVVTARHFRVL